MADGQRNWDWLIPDLHSPLYGVTGERWGQLSNGGGTVPRTRQLHTPCLLASKLLNIFLAGSSCRHPCVYAAFVHFVAAASSPPLIKMLFVGVITPSVPQFGQTAGDESESAGCSPSGQCGRRAVGGRLELRRAKT